MDKDEVVSEDIGCILKGSTETLLPIQLYEFKAHLLEAVEELRMVRLAKHQYEEQISKLLMEKQELAWKNESLSNEEEIIEKRHKDALSVLKKQFHATMCAVELEKGRFQLTAETKERENIGLREDIKVLQLLKYSLQKKVDEMEQKLQLHIMAKEDHMRQLGECEKCFENVTQQILSVNEVHVELEQNVKAATQNIQKLKDEIRKKNEETGHLKEELKKLSSDFINYKVAYQEKASKEKISLLEKEQQLKELKERLQMEKEITNKLLDVNQTLKEEKQGDVKSLSNMVSLVQRHTATINSLETQLSALKEEYKTLERDNELQRANATENEEKFLSLQSEHKKVLQMWKEQKERMKMEHETVGKELASLKEVHSYPSECSKTLYDKQETTKQIEEQQQVNIITTFMNEDEEHDTCENNTQVNPVDNAVSLNPNGFNSKNSEIQNTEKQQCTSESVCKDRSSLPNVYNRIDKAHFCEEQRSDSNVKENKAKFAAAQPGLKENCDDGEPTVEISADRADLQDPDEDGESASKCSRSLQTQAIMESVMLLRDNNKPLTVCSQEASQQTDCSHRKSGDGTSEVVYIVIDKTDTTENKQGVLINETHVKESQLFPQTTEQLINEQTADREEPAYGDSTGCIAWDENNYSSSVLNCSTSEASMTSCNNKESKQPLKPIQLSNASNASLSVDSNHSKQTENDNQNVFKEDVSKNFDDLKSPGCATTMGNESCIEQEQISLSSPSIALDSCEVPVKNMHLLPASDPKQAFLDSQINLENADTSEVNVDGKDMFTRMREEEENTSDINFRRGLFADGQCVNICQITEETNKPPSVEKEIIIEGNNVPGNFTLEESSGQTSSNVSKKVVSSSTEVANTNLQREWVTNTFSSCQKRCLSTTTSYDSPSSIKSFSKLGSCTLPYSLSRDTCTKGTSIKRLAFDNLSMNVHPVPRKDPSAEWNAIVQTFHNSPFPTEDINVSEKQSCGSNNSSAACSTSPNIAQTKAKLVYGQGKVESSSQSSIKHQINAIEKFLQKHKLNGSKKRKLEDKNQ